MVDTACPEKIKSRLFFHLPYFQAFLRRCNFLLNASPLGPYLHLSTSVTLTSIGFEHHSSPSTLNSQRMLLFLGGHLFANREQ
jgi:hypothetical protein